jgi:lipopolysaccharide/colanic/teichoic acid biosynthesis glycosyltransferase
MNYRAVKRILDVCLAVPGLIAATPLLAVIAVAIKAGGPGPILYRGTRVGAGGRPFSMLKFRTMYGGAPDVRNPDGSTYTGADDSRVTPVGRWLRRTSLDELPQLWNVVRGDMSLVGPRPPIPEEVARYQRWQRRRLAMKPGLTCLWQISGRNNLDFDRWIELDLQYIDSWTPLLDLKILLKTIPVVLSGKGAS